MSTWVVENYLSDTWKILAVNVVQQFKCLTQFSNACGKTIFIALGGGGTGIIPGNVQTL